MKTLIFSLAVSMIFSMGLFFQARGESGLQVRYEFGSSADHFFIDKKGNRHLLQGHPVELGDFAEFMPLFSKVFGEDCGDLSSVTPDLRVQRILPSAAGLEPDQMTTLSFYIEKKKVSNGKKCASVGGNGMYYLPLHRSWFQTGEKANLVLGPTLEILKNEEKLASFRQQEGEWISNELFTNWDFFERFIASLKNYSIEHRLHPLAGEGKNQFQLNTQGKSYHFYKVGKNLWALKAPDAKWLVASPDWAFWQDMDRSEWADRFEAKLGIILDKTKEVEVRRESLKSISKSWSVTIKKSLHKIVLDSEDEDDLKILAVKMLKQKPSDDNITVLIKALKHTKDPYLLSLISRSLRVKDPKAPLLDEDSDETERNKVLVYWSKWLKGKGL